MPVSYATQFRNARTSANTQLPLTQPEGLFLRRLREKHKDEDSEFCECHLKVNIWRTNWNSASSSILFQRKYLRDSWSWYQGDIEELTMSWPELRLESLGKAREWLKLKHEEGRYSHNQMSFQHDAGFQTKSKTNKSSNWVCTEHKNIKKCLGNKKLYEGKRLLHYKGNLFLWR